MNEILETKLKEYRNSYFENKEFKAWLKDSDLWMPVYTCLRIKGVEMDKKELVNVIDGKLMTELPLDIYGFVNRFKALYKEMQASVGMLESMNEALFAKFYDILIEGDGYRQENPVIYKWGYVAPHFNQIKTSLASLFKLIDKMDNPIKRAITAHLGVLKIYPYSKDTEIMATIAMYYELMIANIPLMSFTVDDIDYNKLVASYLKEDSQELSDMIERSLLNRIDSVMMFGIESRER